MTTPPRGFTLLEIMVVLVLIGIITSFALLSVGGGPRERLAEEARRLAALVELHQQEAILSGELRGIQFGRAGYAILSLGEKGEWRPPATADTLIRHVLPEDIALGLWIEGRPADLKTTGKLPQVVLLASGETTEFVAVFGFADDRSPDAPRYRVAGDALGRLTTGEVTPVNRQPGFTLLEVLVALAVLAIAMGAIIHAATQSINTVATLRDRTFASWVALNRVNALLLEAKPWPEEGSRKGNAELANRNWRWEARFHKTADPDLRRLELTVRIDEAGAELSKLIAFKGKPPEKPTDATDQPPGATDKPAAPKDKPTPPKTPQPAL